MHGPLVTIMLAFLLTMAAASGGTYWYARKRKVAPQTAVKASGVAALGSALLYATIYGLIATISAFFWPVAIALPLAGGYFYYKSKQTKALPPSPSAEQDAL